MSGLDIALVVVAVVLLGALGFSWYAFVLWARGAQREHQAGLQAAHERCVKAQAEQAERHARELERTVAVHAAQLEATASREEREGHERVAERESLLGALRERDTLVATLLEQLSKPLVVPASEPSLVRRDEDIDGEFRGRPEARVDWDSDLAPLPGDT